MHTKKVLSLLVIVLMASCATVKTKAVVTPAGNWDYSVTGTPQGDFAGIMTITQQDQQYAATLNANGSDLVFSSFAYTSETGKVVGDFDYSGTSVYFEANFAGDVLNGKMMAGGGEFPFKATRKK